MLAVLRSVSVVIYFCIYRSRLNKNPAKRISANDRIALYIVLPIPDVYIDNASSKCNYMTITQRRTRELPTLYTYLGIHITSELPMHMNMICTKARTLLYRQFYQDAIRQLTSLTTDLILNMHAS